LCLSVAAGFVFISQGLDFSERSAVIGLLIVFPLFAVGVAAWLILQNIRRINLREHDRSINWQIMPPENQRRKLNLEITELAEILAIDESQVSDLRSAYIVAEDLALRKLEQESNISLLRHVSLEAAEFDAVLINEEVIKFVEVTFLVTPNIRQEKITAILRKIDVTKNLLAKKRPGTKLILLLALVTQFDAEAEIKLRATLGEKLLATPVDVDIRLFDFETLQKIYAED
jgi:Holliday junction resolvase-like predicted endonuclease